MKRGNQGRASILAIVVIVIVLVGAVVSFVSFGVIMFAGFKVMEEEMTVNPDDYDTTVMATIINNRKSESSMGEGTDSHTAVVYCPIYQYEYNNEKYTVSGDVSTSDIHYQVGDVTEVWISSTEPDLMYDPNFNAKSVYDDFKKEARGIMIIPTAVGLLIVFAFVAVVIYVIRKRSEVMQVSMEDYEIQNENSWREGDDM